jgi:hypothetical protein
VRTKRPALLLALLFSILALAAACSSSNGEDFEGTYVHEEEGTIEIEGDGKATITQSGDAIAIPYTRDGDKVTFTAESSGESVTATLRGNTLVFEPGDFSGDEETVFTKQ